MSCQDHTLLCCVLQIEDKGLVSGDSGQPPLLHECPQCCNGRNLEPAARPRGREWGKALGFGVAQPTTMADASRRCTTRRRRLRARYATSSTLAQAAPPARACSRVCADAPAPPLSLAPAPRPLPAVALRFAAAGGPPGAGPAFPPLAAASSPEPAAPASEPGPAAGGAGSPARGACSSAARAGLGLMLRAVELEPMAGAQVRSACCGARASAAGGGGSHCARRPARPGSERFRFQD